MHSKTDGIWGAACGVAGGFTKWTFLQIHAPGPEWSHIVEAGGTALICGFLGAVGTHCFKWLRQAWRDYFNKDAK